MSFNKKFQNPAFHCIESHEQKTGIPEIHDAEILIDQGEFPINMHAVQLQHHKGNTASFISHLDHSQRSVCSQQSHHSWSPSTKAQNLHHQ